MEENKKEVSLDEIEKAAGGLVVKDDECQHTNMLLTGVNKVENGVVYHQLKCNKCGKLFWMKGTDLVAPATVVG